MSPLLKAISKFCTTNHLFTNYKIVIVAQIAVSWPMVLDYCPLPYHTYFVCADYLKLQALLPCYSAMVNIYTPKSLKSETWIAILSK